MKKKVKVVKKENENGLLLDELNFKSQAAMEYLMTYGWAILIIALSLAALYSLGVLNPKNFTPRAQPGSCFVFRPNGPGTTDYISLQGTCGYLPMYVASFNGVDAYIPATVPQINTASGGYNTVTFWMYWNGVSGQIPFGFSSYDLYFACSCLGFNTANSDTYGVSSSNLAKKWVFVAAVFYNGNYAGNNKIYINGAPQTLSQCCGSPISRSATTNLRISGWPSGGYYFNGLITNVQVYNTLLNDQEIQYLYQEGLGGAPIRLGSLVGWWPLNGDAKDYSGNGNHGTINGGVTFLQNYNPPWFYQFKQF